MPQDFIKALFNHSNMTINKIKLFDKVELCNYYYIALCKFLKKLSCSIDYENYNEIFKIIHNSNINKLHVGIYKENRSNNLPKDILYLIGKNLLISLRSLKLSLYVKGILNLKNLSSFIIICKNRGIQLKTLIFSGNNLFNDLYVYEIAKYYGKGQLEELNIGKVNKEFGNCLKTAEMDFKKLIYIK
jgi:hypothetical protein